MGSDAVKLLAVGHRALRSGCDQWDAVINVRHAAAELRAAESDRVPFRLSCVGCGADAAKCSIRGAASHWLDGGKARHADGAGGVVCSDCRTRRAEAPVLDFTGHAAAIREMQGANAADPMPGDVDLFTGALFEAPAHEVGRRVLVLGGGVQEPLF